MSSSPTYQAELFPHIQARIFLYWVQARSPLLSRLSKNILRESALYLGDLCHLLPSIHRSCLVLTDVVAGHTATLELSVSFSDWSFFCQMDWHRVLGVGGKPAVVDTFCIDLWSGGITPQASMSAARSSPGIIKHGSYVYIFGGYDDKIDILACEKFHTTHMRWEALPSMQYPRDGFTPCYHAGKILLCDMGYFHRKLEAFSVKMETFELLPVTLPDSFTSNTVSFMIDEELVVVVSGGKIARMRLGEKTTFRVSALSMNKEDSGLSNIPPLWVGEEAFWVRWNDGGIVKFNAKTSLLSE